MNRLVIIGNGFDLAHGLPTSYKDFIDDFWKNIKNSNHNELIEFNIGSYVEFNGHENLSDLIDMIVPMDGSFKREGIGVYKLKDFLKPLADNRIQILQYKNQLFRLLNQISIENWVDVENEYYTELKKILKSTSLSIEYKKRYVRNLNKEFEEIKNLLEEYLKEKVLKKFNLGLYPDAKGGEFKFRNIIKPISVFNSELNLFNEFPKEDCGEIESQFNEEKKDGKEKKSLFVLNFNYTPTILRYLIDQGIDESLEKNHVPIHGTLGDVIHNKINFGFGDEMDDDYKTIENLDDNEYLKNFKSFQYLQNSNYKRLLDFVDSEKFQVVIMGHSCGLSDRTLLNTVFEHNNCRSIKVFYHQKDDKTDNYTEITQNISRHFNDKKLMREKIVNKTLCQALPQIQLPLK